MHWRRLGRIALVTLGLTLTGALVGALLSIAAFAGLGLAEYGVSGFPFGAPELVFAAILGAVYGGVSAAPVAWWLLRAVPLGRAIVETAVGTLLGFALLAWLAPGTAALGPPLGLVLGALQLRARYRDGTPGAER